MRHNYLPWPKGGMFREEDVEAALAKVEAQRQRARARNSGLTN